MIHTRPSKHPPRRGPFAALGTLFKETRRTVFDEDGWSDDRRLDAAFPSVEFPASHPLAPYLGYEQNDAMVLGCTFESEALSLTIDHYNIWRLASVVQDDGWKLPRDRFPVTLRFEGVRQCYVVLQAGIGEYRLLRTSRSDLASALFDVVGLKCIGANADSFRFHLRVHSRRTYKMPRENWGWAGEIDVLLECETVTVEESLYDEWIKVAGADTLPLLDNFLAQGPVHQSWSVDDFEAFVATRTTS